MLPITADFRLVQGICQDAPMASRGRRLPSVSIWAALVRDDEPDVNSRPVVPVVIDRMRGAKRQ